MQIDHKINIKKVQAILALEPPELYSHFIKKAAGWGKIWGLYNEGWATTKSIDGAIILPVWPELEYAILMATDCWETFKPKEIELEEVLSDMIPYLRTQKISLGVFYRQNFGSVACTLDEFEIDLKAELEKYT
jgi:hypothetical protein